MKRKYINVVKIVYEILFRKKINPPLQALLYCFRFSKV